MTIASGCIHFNRFRCDLRALVMEVEAAWLMGVRVSATGPMPDESMQSVFSVERALAVNLQAVALILTVAGGLHVSIKSHDGCIWGGRFGQLRHISEWATQVGIYILNGAYIRSWAYRLSSADTKLLYGLYFCGDLYMLQIRRSLHGSSLNLSCCMILSTFCRIGL